MKHPHISVLVGRVQRRKLDPNTMKYELINMAINGVLGRD